MGLRIPKALAEEAGVGAGSEVDLSVEGGELIARPTRATRSDLKKLLRKVRPGNLHREVETGPSTGREAW